MSAMTLSRVSVKHLVDLVTRRRSSSIIRLSPLFVCTVSFHTYCSLAPYSTLYSVCSRFCATKYGQIIHACRTKRQKRGRKRLVRPLQLVARLTKISLLEDPQKQAKAKDNPTDRRRQEVRKKKHNGVFYEYPSFASSNESYRIRPEIGWWSNKDEETIVIAATQGP